MKTPIIAFLILILVLNSCNQKSSLDLDKLQANFSQIPNKLLNIKYKKSINSDNIILIKDNKSYAGYDYMSDSKDYKLEIYFTEYKNNIITLINEQKYENNEWLYKIAYQSFTKKNNKWIENTNKIFNQNIANVLNDKLLIHSNNSFLKNPLKIYFKDKNIVIGNKYSNFIELEKSLNQFKIKYVSENIVLNYTEEFISLFQPFELPLILYEPDLDLGNKIPENYKNIIQQIFYNKNYIDITAGKLIYQDSRQIYLSFYVKNNANKVSEYLCALDKKSLSYLKKWKLKLSEPDTSNEENHKVSYIFKKAKKEIPIEITCYLNSYQFINLN